MSSWETLLGIRWSKSLCDRSGECCRGAAQVRPWERLLHVAAHGDTTARDFLGQFIPYASLEEAKRHAPHALEASLKIARERADADEDLVLYHCRFLEGQSTCRIYEDRPQLCRDFPESPFGAIPRCCGYASLTRECLAKVDALRQELESAKQQLEALQQKAQ